MNNVEQLADRLKQDTLEHHQQLEKVIVGKIKAITSIAGYTALLKHFYSFFGALEEALPVDLIENYLPDYRYRHKKEKLKSDILACGGQLPEIKQKSLPVVDTAAKAMGALYVMEGSSLGGQIISKMIARALNLSDDKSLSYFVGYGAQTESMWEVFKGAINRISGNEADEVVTTANDTFIKFKERITENDRKEEF